MRRPCLSLLARPSKRERPSPQGALLSRRRVLRRNQAAVGPRGDPQALSPRCHAVKDRKEEARPAAQAVSRAAPRPRPDSEAEPGSPRGSGTTRTRPLPIGQKRRKRQRQGKELQDGHMDGESKTERERIQKR
ncbi:hypothetical protein NDU88_005945 [Pleurodeles waltl]|uniref:Uncharacterized protein n=1 Tax=Pleurodeles waltl TaxID=8319 RepID=A0AAV7TE49_PLEWA|nr:hypothetical protein NDU88_005945 [Pleurodeles waltl]